MSFTRQDDAEISIDRLRELERELDEQKRLAKQWRDERDFYREMLDTLNFSVVALTPDGRYLFFNEFNSILSGIPMEYIEKHFVSRLRVFDPDNPVVIPEKREEVTRFFKGVLEHPAIRRFEVETRAVTNDTVTVEIVALPVFDDAGRLKYLLTVSNDVTELRRAEAALKGAKERAEQANALKDKFVSLVAHDLRSPIATMGWMMNLIADESNGSGSQSEKLARRAIGDCERMVKLIDDLLNPGRFESGKVLSDPAVLDLRLLCDSLAAGLKQKADRKGVAIVNNVAQDCRVEADKTLFPQVLLNLMGNALKYSSHGGTVTLSSTSTETGTIITVGDTGAGMPAEQLMRLFSTDGVPPTVGTAGEKGAGLGLSLCREIIAAHGGAITAESAPGTGSAFHIALPRHSTQPPGGR